MIRGNGFTIAIAGRRSLLTILLWAEERGKVGEDSTPAAATNCGDAETSWRRFSGGSGSWHAGRVARHQPNQQLRAPCFPEQAPVGYHVLARTVTPRPDAQRQQNQPAIEICPGHAPGRLCSSVHSHHLTALRRLLGVRREWCGGRNRGCSSRGAGVPLSRHGGARLEQGWSQGRGRVVRQSDEGGAPLEQGWSQGRGRVVRPSRTAGASSHHLFGPEGERFSSPGGRGSSSGGPSSRRRCRVSETEYPAWELGRGEIGGQCSLVELGWPVFERHEERGTRTPTRARARHSRRG